MDDLRPFSQNMREVFFQALDELALPFPAVRLPDWPEWTRLTGGFRGKEFTILCGSTGSGKTMFLANLSAHLLRQGTKHFVMSVETGHTDFMKRVISVFAEEDINTGDPISVDKLQRITEKNKEYFARDTIEFSLYDNRVSVEQLIQDLEYMAFIGCKIAFIDNLNFFLEVTSAANQLVETDRVIHELIMFCKRVDMHLVMVMHPKKTEGKQGNRVTSEFDIKGSSTAVQEAHNVFLFNRPDPEDIANKARDYTDRELTIAKMRRRGKYVGSTILFHTIGVTYLEGGVV